jgi:hypothetical protein
LEWCREARRAWGLKRTLGLGGRGLEGGRCRGCLSGRTWRWKGRAVWWRVGGGLIGWCRVCLRLVVVVVVVWWSLMGWFGGSGESFGRLRKDLGHRQVYRRKTGGISGCSCEICDVYRTGCLLLGRHYADAFASPQTPCVVAREDSAMPIPHPCMLYHNATQATPHDLCPTPGK